jgi:TatD DNase family protein
LDRKSRVPTNVQRQVFESVLAGVSQTPRPVSIHSAGMTADVLDVISRHPSPGLILHWWRGTKDETQAAVDLGCYFSVNGAEIKSPRVIGLVPRDRILTETDFPFTSRRDKRAKRPGEVSSIEEALARVWEADEWSVRSQVWRNLRVLLERTGSASKLSRGLQAAMLAS